MKTKISTFKYRGSTISLVLEKAIEESTPLYVVYRGRKLHTGLRHSDKSKAMQEYFRTIHEFCRF